VNTGTREAVFI